MCRNPQIWGRYCWVQVRINELNKCYIKENIDVHNVGSSWSMLLLSAFSIRTLQPHILLHIYIYRVNFNYLNTKLKTYRIWRRIFFRHFSYILSSTITRISKLNTHKTKWFNIWHKKFDVPKPSKIISLSIFWILNQLYPYSQGSNIRLHNAL
jgi:hypothetical protein